METTTDFAARCRAQVAGRRAMAAQAADTERIFAALAGNDPVPDVESWPYPNLYLTRGTPAPSRRKYWCQACDHVAKSRAPAPVCPSCRTPMRAMGKIWKPGRKGSRFRRYPEGWRATRPRGDTGWETEILGTTRPRPVPWEGAYLWRYSDKRKVKGKIPPTGLRGA